MLNYVIRYENIKDDYLTALRKVIKTEPMPIANQTVGGRKLLDYYADEIKDQAIFVLRFIKA